MYRSLFLIIFLLWGSVNVFAVDFSELDKPPDGIYGGQLLITAQIGMGIPRGSIIDSEKKFVKGSTYTFTDIDTTKALWITHLAYSYGINAEYVIIDYIGFMARVGSLTVVQRTNHGTDYENKKGTLFRNYSFVVGPVFHATTRKPWDVCLSPFAGFSKGYFYAIPIARKTLPSFDPSNYKGAGSTLVYGAELKAGVFFSGGVVIYLGFEWMRNNIKLKHPISEPNSQTGKTYLDGKTSGVIDTYQITLSAGYAFKN